MLVAMVCGTLAFAGVICLDCPFMTNIQRLEASGEAHGSRAAGSSTVLFKCSSEECTSIYLPWETASRAVSVLCAMPVSRADAVHLSSRTHSWRISRVFYVKMDLPRLAASRRVRSTRNQFLPSLIAASLIRPCKYCMLYWSVAQLHSDAWHCASRSSGSHISVIHRRDMSFATNGFLQSLPRVLPGRCSYEYHSAATHRPLLITGAWWLLAVNTHEEDHRRGRRTRGSTYYYGSRFFFYFFYYSFAEYVDIDSLIYVMAEGK